jgi:arabinofuranosyltransferase
MALNAALVLAALGWAWHLVSLFDDAYISLRYARNFVRGEGLVFNAGERVEGYTNFLWTMFLAEGMAMGFDGPHVAIVGCLTAFAVELPLLARLGRLLSTRPDQHPFPIAAIVLGGGYTFATYGTSGMETMLTTLLVTLALDRAVAGKPGPAGFCGVLATMNHPDAAVLYAGLGASLWLDAAQRKSFWRYFVPVVAVYLPYFLIRWHYYGDLFPNTYYAKSGGESYFSQGFTYLLISGCGSGLLALLPLAGVSLRQRPRALLSRFAWLGAVPYLIYVAKVGGDFMLGRLLVPVLPPFALLAEQGLEDLLATRPGWPLWLAAGSLAIAAAPARIIPEHEQLGGVADERTYYKVSQFWPRVEQDEINRPMRKVLTELAERGAHPIVAAKTIGVIGYNTDFPVIDWYGLTDRNVAHMSIAGRGRPGHEKMAPPRYIRSRGVTISDIPMYPQAYFRWTRVRIDDGEVSLGRYDPRLVATLASIPGVHPPDVPGHIDHYLARAAQGRSPRVRQDVAFLDDYYFSVNSDPDRYARVHALLGGPEPVAQSAAADEP